VTAPQQQRIIGHGAPGSEALLIALNAAVLYLAVSLAGVLGAGVLHTLGAAYVPLVAACFTAAAAAVTALTGRAGRRAGTGAARRPATGVPSSRR
jgi:DHA1 family inner membrane transport protein